MKIVSTIEARMTSSRLPGKALLKVLNKPILHFLVERLKRVNLIEEIILATTTNSQDDELEHFAKYEKIKCYRGSEHDVMTRVLEAAEISNADLIVQITGDCPIIDPDIVEQTVKTYLKNNVDYVNNLNSYPIGMDVQVFSLKILKKSSRMTDDILDREHVTFHIRKNPKIFTCINLVAPQYLRRPELGLTLDEELDFVLLKKIIEHFGDNKIFSCYEAIKFLESRRDLLSINDKVIRKDF